MMKNALHISKLSGISVYIHIAQKRRKKTMKKNRFSDCVWVSTFYLRKIRHAFDKVIKSMCLSHFNFAELFPLFFVKKNQINTMNINGLRCVGRLLKSVCSEHIRIVIQNTFVSLFVEKNVLFYSAALLIISQKKSK